MTWMRGPYHYITVWYMSKTNLSPLSSSCQPGRYLWSKDILIWLPTTYKACQTPFICIKWIWYEYEVDGRLLSLHNSNIWANNWDHLLCWGCHLQSDGMVFHPYGHPPQIKHAKHLLYVWSGSGMSMKWMGGRNHILQHVRCTQYPTTQSTPFRLMVWYGVVALLLPAMVEGF